MKDNKELILREQLALQRTTLANQSTFLSFLRTSMYFLVAGLSIENVLKLENSLLFEISFFVVSFVILFFGILNYFRNKSSISKSKKHIGDYKKEYNE